jgi:hypothetical protein
MSSVRQSLRCLQTAWSAIHDGRKLHGDGWVVKVVAKNLEARHSEVRTYAEVVDRLHRLHIEEDATCDIAEWNNDGKRLWPV